ncbi:MAG: cytochrome d ubiquinol oxidase subunit II [Spirochaetes bacterium]|nr:cytochrome d ubiquinol oxidase subunit II [Spirochaetota bacterium]
METLQALQIIWFLLIGILLAGYTVLDGFDLGVGSLLPLLAKEEKETAVLFTSIGPLWDGNEVWLLTAGGALFAAFPHVYATVFSGFYLAMMLILFALIFRAVSLEFWSLDNNRRSLWKWAFTAGSLVPSVLFGVALGNVILGIPMNESMEFTGDFFTLLRPFPLAIGILGLSAILLQGSTFAAMKTGGALHERSRAAAKRAWFLLVAMMIIAIALSSVYIPAGMTNPLAWGCTGVVFAALVIGRIWMNRDNDTIPFLMSSIACVGLWGIAGSLQFPNLVNAAGEVGLSLSIYNASSSRLTLSVMLIIAAVGMPVVIAYTIYVYRLFRGKVDLGR